MISFVLLPVRRNGKWFTSLVISLENPFLVTTSAAILYYEVQRRDDVFSLVASSKKWQMVHVTGESVSGGDNECGDKQVLQAPPKKSDSGFIQ